MRFSWVRLAAVAIGSMLLGCATRSTGGSSEAVVSGNWMTAPTLAYDFQVTSSFSTTLRDGNLALLPGPDDGNLRWEGALSMDPVRKFRDQSIGHLVSLLEVSLDDGAGAGPQPSGLSGRSIELRAFDDGELLGIDLLEHVTGPDRLGDLLLPLWGALWVDPPHLNHGASAQRQSVLPFLLDERGGIRVSRKLVWTYLGQDTSPEGVRCHHFEYEGLLAGQGKDLNAAWRSEPRLGGRCSGEVWMRSTDLVQQRHTFHWELNAVVLFQRVEDIADPMAPAPYPEKITLLGQVSQHQVTDGLLTLRTGAP